MSNFLQVIGEVLRLKSNGISRPSFFSAT